MSIKSIWAFGRVDQGERRKRGLLFKQKEARIAEARLKRAGEVQQAESRADRLGLRERRSMREAAERAAVNTERGGDSGGSLKRAWERSKQAKSRKK